MSLFEIIVVVLLAFVVLNQLSIIGWLGRIRTELIKIEANTYKRRQ